jgi:TRAP-type C4-dicarboxylate transport system substrate-binding protein
MTARERGARHVPLLLLLLGLWLRPAAAAEFEWTIQSFRPADAMQTTMFETFADTVETASGGRIAIDVLPAGAVVPSDETPRAINAGLLQGHYSAPSYFAGLDPAFALLGDTLGAYPDPMARDRWFAEGGGLELARDLYARYGLRFIGPVYQPADWMPSIVPLAAVEDLLGLRLRSPGGLVGDHLRETGADARTQPASRTFRALENGDIDATDWATLLENRASRLYDVAPHNVMMRHSMVVTEVAVGLDAWNALPADLQDLVEAELATFSADMAAAFKGAEAEAIAELEATGVESIVWDEPAASGLREVVRAVWARWRERSQLGATIIDSHQAFMRQTGLN